MRTLLLFSLILLNLNLFSQNVQTERGADPPECIIGLTSPHIVGETRAYSYGGLTAVGLTPIYKWYQDGSASVSFPNGDNHQSVDVTLNSPGTLCLRVTITYREGMRGQQCSECFETCDLEGMVDYHGDIHYQINGSDVTFYPTTSNTSLYSYWWQVNGDEPPGWDQPSITIPLPYCQEGAIDNVVLNIFNINMPEDFGCKAKLGINFEPGLCTNRPPIEDKLIVVISDSNTIKVKGENIEVYKIMVYDANSNLMLNSDLKAELNIANLKNGIYFYKIIDENNVLIKNGNFLKK